MQRDAFLDRYFVHNTKLKPGRTIIYIHIIYTYKYTYNDNICWFCVLKIASQNLKKQIFLYNILFILFNYLQVDEFTELKSSFAA